MLQKIRDNSQGLWAKIFIGFIVLVFALFGVEYLVGSLLNAPESVISVNGVEITETEVAQETQRRVQQQMQSMGPDADMNSIDENLMREMAINDLIQQTLLYQAALEVGLAVSPGFLDRQIASIPEFQVDGAFNNQRAQTVLMSAGLTPSSFRESLRREALMNQVLTAYSASGFTTRAQLEQLAELTEQTRDFRYLMINMQDRAANLEISDAAVEEFYQNNQQDFMREEQVALAYLVLDRDRIAEGVEVSEEEIEAQYQRELQAFQSQVERRASHILLEAGSDEEVRQALEQARELRQRIADGESFEDLAMEYSDDTGSAADGGDVGYTTGDSFVEEFEQALASLEVDGVSDPVVSDFGVHLIKLTEQSSTDFEALEQARERIVADLSQARAEELYNQRAEQLSNLAFESLDLQEPADIMELELQQSELAGRSGGTGITANPAVIQEAFSPYVLDDGLNSELIRLDDNRSAVIRVTEHNPSQVRPLDEARGEIQVMLRQQRVEEMAAELGGTVARNLRNDQNIDTILAEQELSWVQAEAVGRDNTELPPQLIDQVFSMARPGEEGGTTVEGFSLANGNYVVVQLQGVTAGSIEDLDATELQSMESFVAQQSGSQAFNAFMTSRQNSAEIER